MTRQGIDPRTHERIYHALARGVATSQNDIERMTGMAPQTVRKLVNQLPELHGFTLDQAEAIRAQGVALDTAASIVATYQDTSIADQASQLGTTSNAVRQLQWRLARAGVLIQRLSFAARERRRNRDALLVRRCCELARAGYTYQAISAELKQPQGRVRKILAMHGGATKLRTDGYSLAEVAAVFSVKPDAVRWWVDQGWLTAQRNTGRRNARHRVTQADLIAFVRCRAAWPAYTPAQIQAAELQQQARQARATAGGRWISRKELAARFDAEESTVRCWINDYGWLAGWETTHAGRAIYHWWKDGTPLEVPANARKAKH